MASIDQILNERRATAVAKVRESLRKDPFYEEMSPKDLISRSGRDTGWFTTENVAGVQRRLKIYLPSKFPDVPPVIKIEGGADQIFLKNPHVFRSGWICILPGSASVDAGRPDEVVKYCVQQAIDILTQDHSEDFREEFAIYWRLDSGSDSRQFLLTEPLEKLEQGCCAEILNKYIIIGSSVASITSWVSAFLGEHTHTGTIRPCIIADLDRPLLPEQYPKTIWEVRELVRVGAPAVLDALDEQICSTVQFFSLLFKQQSEDGPVLAGVVTFSKGLRNSTKINGFRPGKAPNKILIAKKRGNLQNSSVDRGNVQRVDHKWIHSRGGDGNDLASKKVLLIGCGSLGGYVAHLLGRAGIGNLTFLDNDKLEWENVGRHVLGASKVGLSKANALCMRLQQELPHLCIDHFYGDWRDWIAAGNSDKFDCFNLVVSTVGDWSCERPLNLLKRRESTPLILFGWIEPYGVAGHVLLTHHLGGCLECGFNQFGHFSRRVANFDATTLTKEPGGCTYYQEYGPLNVIPIAEMISKCAVDALMEHPKQSYLRSWVGPINSIMKNGGEITEFWRDKLCTYYVSQTLEMEWMKHKDCEICS